MTLLLLGSARWRCSLGDSTRSLLEISKPLLECPPCGRVVQNPFGNGEWVGWTRKGGREGRFLCDAKEDRT